MNYEVNLMFERNFCSVSGRKECIAQSILIHDVP